MSTPRNPENHHATKEDTGSPWESKGVYSGMDVREKIAADLVRSRRVSLLGDVRFFLGEDEEWVIFDMLNSIAMGQIPEAYYAENKEKRENIQRIIDTNLDWYRMRVTPEKLYQTLKIFEFIERLAGEKSENEIPEEYRKIEVGKDILQVIYFFNDVFRYFVQTKRMQRKKGKNEVVDSDVVQKSISYEVNIENMLKNAGRWIGGVQYYRVMAWESKYGKKTRNGLKEHDLCTLLSCESNQIAHSIEEVNENTKAYVGKVEPNLLKMLPKNVEHIYTSLFPERRIYKEQMMIGGMTEKEIEAYLKQSGYKMSPEAVSAIARATLKKEGRSIDSPQKINIVRIRMEDLGFPRGSTIYTRAKVLGFEIIPPEGVLRYRLCYANQKMGEYIYLQIGAHNEQDIARNMLCIKRNVEGMWIDVGRPRMQDELIFAY